MIKHHINIATYLAGNNQKLPVCYLAGKVSGLPYAEVWAKFKQQEIEMEVKGFYVLNPLNFIGEHEEWPVAMKISVLLLASADHISLQSDWHLSDGATLERNLALPLQISTIED